MINKGEEKDLRRKKFISDHLGDWHAQRGVIGPMKGFSRPERVIFRRLQKQSISMLSSDELVKMREEGRMQLDVEKEELRREALEKKARAHEELIAKITAIVQMRKEGATLREIGERYGVTRQRIFQLVRQWCAPDEILIFKRQPKVMLEAKCETCGTLIPYRQGTKPRRWCSRAHRRKFKSKAECDIWHRENRKRMYHEDPEYRARVRERNKKQWLKHKDDETYIQKNRIYVKRHEEFKKFGYAITPLPENVVRHRRDKQTIPSESDMKAQPGEEKRQTELASPETDPSST